MNYDKIYKIPGISELDNLAYRLYWNENKNNRRFVYEASCNFFKNRDKYVNYYSESKSILRKEKIKKLSKK